MIALLVRAVTFSARRPQAAAVPETHPPSGTAASHLNPRLTARVKVGA